MVTVGRVAIVDTVAMVLLIVRVDEDVVGEI